MAAGKSCLASIALAHVLTLTLGGGRVVAEWAAGVGPLAPPSDGARRCCCGTPDGRCCGMACCRSQTPQPRSSAAVVDLRPGWDWWCAPRTGGLRIGPRALASTEELAAHGQETAAPDTLQRKGVRLNI